MGNSLRHRCSYGCTTGDCGSKELYDRWLGDELYLAISNQNLEKIEELLNVSPHLKEGELTCPGEQANMSALGLAIHRRDVKVLKALLRGGVSPNLKIPDQQREVYERRSQQAALNGGDMDLQYLVPATHFEAVCSVQQKEVMLVLLEHGANANGGLILTCHAGDGEMLEALLSKGGADPNLWQRRSSPLISSVKSKIQPCDKVLALLRRGADPNFVGPPPKRGSPPYPPLVISTRKRDYRMVRILLEAGADVNAIVEDEGLPTPLFWAVYWGELELLKLFTTLSTHRLDLHVKKYTQESVFEVARTALNFAKMRRPKHIAKLALPNRPPAVYEKIIQVLEEYVAQHPELMPMCLNSSSRSTAATRTEQFQTDRLSGAPTPSGGRDGSPRLEAV